MFPFGLKDDPVPEKFKEEARKVVMKTVRDRERREDVQKLERSLNKLPEVDRTTTELGKPPSGVAGKFRLPHIKHIRSADSRHSLLRSRSNSMTSLVSGTTSLFSGTTSLVSGTSSMLSSLSGSTSAVSSPPTDCKAPTYYPPVPSRTIMSADKLIQIVTQAPSTHIGYMISKDLEEKLVRQNWKDTFVDWDLNLFRAMLFVNSDTLGKEYRDARELFVSYGKDLGSELEKLATIDDRRYREMLSHMASESFWPRARVLHRTQMRVQRYSPAMSDTEFQNLLIDSDINQEFKIDREFRQRTAATSFANAVSICSQRNDAMRLALRNYLLNMLVAAQTLFEFNYSLGLGDDKIRSLSDAELGRLWLQIRDRNFQRISQLA